MTMFSTSFKVGGYQNEVLYIVDAPHDDVQHFVLVAADLVDRHDVGMLEPGDRTCLAHEADGERRGRREPEIHDLHRDVAARPMLPRAKHRGEPAFAQQVADGKFISQGLLQALAQRGDIEGHDGRET